MQQVILLALQAFADLLNTGTTSAQIAKIITFLEQIIPLAVQLGQAVYTGIKNIIAAARGQTSDADLLAALDALDAQTDAAFDAIANQVDPADAAAGQAAANDASGSSSGS